MEKVDAPTKRNEIILTAAGDVGIGKSRLLGCIENVLLEAGIQVKWADEVTATQEKNMVHLLGSLEMLKEYDPAVVLNEIVLRPIITQYPAAGDNSMDGASALAFTSYMKKITNPDDLEVAREYWLRDKQSGVVRRGICGDYDSWKYITYISANGGGDKFWANQSNNQAMEKWDIIGPIPDLIPPFEEMFLEMKQDQSILVSGSVSINSDNNHPALAPKDWVASAEV